MNAKSFCGRIYHIRSANCQDSCQTVVPDSASMQDALDSGWHGGA